MALDDPNGLSPAGTLVACPSHLSPYEGAPQPGERAYSGTVIPDDSGGFSLEMESGRWPLITLEPGLDQWLNTLDRPTQTTLIANANPWGPWLRASRRAR